MIFKVKNISKKYGRKIVLNKFSYEFKSGLYLLTGANGVGKSTLLKILSKIIYPSNENYYITDIKVAYLCEKIELINIRVINFLSKIAKMNGYEVDLKKLITEWMIPNKKVNNLSKGNKQKVAILMMLLTDSEIYVFDEPTNALDEYAIGKLISFVNDLIKREKTVIISTHDKECFKYLKHEEIRLGC